MILIIGPLKKLGLSFPLTFLLTSGVVPSTKLEAVPVFLLTPEGSFISAEGHPSFQLHTLGGRMEVRFKKTSQKENLCPKSSTEKKRLFEVSSVLGKIKSRH